MDELVSERLQVFLSGQARPETSVSVSLDGAAIVLYEDGGAQVGYSRLRRVNPQIPSWTCLRL